MALLSRLNNQSQLEETVQENHPPPSPSVPTLTLTLDLTLAQRHFHLPTSGLKSMFHKERHSTFVCIPDVFTPLNLTLQLELEADANGRVHVLLLTLRISGQEYTSNDI